MTIERTLRLIAGILLLVSLLMAHYHHPNWLWFSAFIGLNLFQSGLTNWCPMMAILQKAGVKGGCGSNGA
ncbi:MAG: YgaP family membrane protein [Armatimonadota bacterium]